MLPLSSNFHKIYNNNKNLRMCLNAYVRMHNKLISLSTERSVIQNDQNVGQVGKVRRKGWKRGREGEKRYIPLSGIHML